jgi:thymidylate kinase
MRETKLILLEGIPGSGKSTMAQTLLHDLAAEGIAARWWYEEEVGHPVYVFRDRASLHAVLGALRTGRYREVVARALDQWRAFAGALRSTEQVVLLDGCLFGYLTWSLFPHAVPAAEIHAYLAEVVRLLMPVAPCLVYLYQDDIAASLRRVCSARGTAIEHNYIQHVQESAYGQRHGLRGFTGLVSYWTAYRAFTDSARAAIGWPTLAVETSMGAWPAYHRRVAVFLGLPQLEEAAIPDAELGRAVGRYQSLDDASLTCTVRLAEGALVVDGLPEAWPDSRLVPLSPGLFAVASLPITVAFEESGPGTATLMRVSGPELLGGTVANIFQRVPGT